MPIFLGADANILLKPSISSANLHRNRLDATACSFVLLCAPLCSFVVKGFAQPVAKSAYLPVKFTLNLKTLKPLKPFCVKRSGSH